MNFVFMSGQYAVKAEKACAEVNRRHDQITEQKRPQYRDASNFKAQCTIPPSRPSESIPSLLPCYETAC